MTRLTIKEIRMRLQDETSLESEFVRSLDDNPKKGVQATLAAFKRRIEQELVRRKSFEHRFMYEKQFWQSGIQYVAGIDEVGRGPLAGPVVTAAVIIDDHFDLMDVTDSKQLSAHQREQLYLRIIHEAVEVNIAVKDNHFIDRENIYHATQLAMIESVNGLQHHPGQLIVDAVPLQIDIPQTTLIKGDQKSISVAAASIVAKEYRDHLMAVYDQLYPGYDFAHNMGYGTQKHIAGLRTQGITPIHRLSFAPVKKYQ